MHNIQSMLHACCCSRDMLGYSESKFKCRGIYLCPPTRTHMHTLHTHAHACTHTSSGLQRATVQQLVETVDVWSVGSGGSVDFRVSSEDFQEMKGDLPECKVEGGVEELVRKMEKQYLNRTQQEWFEEYVSTNLEVYDKKCVCLTHHAVWLALAIVNILVLELQIPFEELIMI